MSTTTSRDVSTKVEGESTRAEGGHKITGMSTTDSTTQVVRAVADPDKETSRAMEVERVIAEEGVDEGYIAEYAANKPEVQASIQASKEYAQAVQERTDKTKAEREKVKSDRTAAAKSASTARPKTEAEVRP